MLSTFYCFVVKGKLIAKSLAPLGVKHQYLRIFIHYCPKTLLLAIPINCVLQLTNGLSVPRIVVFFFVYRRLTSRSADWPAELIGKPSNDLCSQMLTVHVEINIQVEKDESVYLLYRKNASL